GGAGQYPAAAVERTHSRVEPRRRSGADPGARVGEHARDHGGNGLSVERRAGAAAGGSRVSIDLRAGGRRCAAEISRRARRRSPEPAMNPRRGLAIVAVAGVMTVLAWLLFIALPRCYGGPASTRASAATPSPPPAPPGRKIKARLYYVAEDGARLAAVERDVPYGERHADPGRQDIDATRA